MYNVYHTPDGSAPSFVGQAETIDEAEHLAATGRELPEHLWETARAAGHCDGLRAPEGVESEDEPEWLEYGDGYYCAVPVVG